MNVNKLFSQKSIDHAIKLQKKSFRRLNESIIYSKKQISIVKKYVNKIFNKKYIRSNTFSYAISILIIKNFNKKFRICINYRILNILTIKNRNILFLIKKILIKLYKIKIFNKFDIIIVFNKIRIKKENKKNCFFHTI